MTSQGEYEWVDSLRKLAQRLQCSEEEATQQLTSKRIIRKMVGLRIIYGIPKNKEKSPVAPKAVQPKEKPVSCEALQKPTEKKIMTQIKTPEQTTTPVTLPYREEEVTWYDSQPAMAKAIGRGASVSSISRRFREWPEDRHNIVRRNHPFKKGRVQWGMRPGTTWETTHQVFEELGKLEDEVKRLTDHRERMRIAASAVCVAQIQEDKQMFEEALDALNCVLLETGE